MVDQEKLQEICDILNHSEETEDLPYGAEISYNWNGCRVLLKTEGQIFKMSSNLRDKIISELNLEGPWNISEIVDEEYPCSNCGCSCSNVGNKTYISLNL